MREKVFLWYKNLGKRQKAIVFLILVVSLGFLGWWILKEKKPKVQYQTAKVQRGTVVWSVSASGVVVNANNFEVVTQATGLVKKIYVGEGEMVEAGQKIMELELDMAGKQRNASAWASYLSAKNNLESAKATLYSLDSAMWKANQEFLNDAVSRGLSVDDPTYIQENDDWLAAEAKYKNQKEVVSQAQAALNNAWLSYQLSSAVITAPVSGIILGINYAPGMVIGGSSSSSSNYPVAIIRTEGTPLASFNLSELDVPVVKVGQKASVKLDSLPEKSFTGKVVGVNRLGTVSNGVTNYSAIVRFDAFSEEVLPNMAASASIIIEVKDSVLFVPSLAIQKQAGQSTVVVLENGKERQKIVEVGISSETQVEIISGLSEGEEVVIGRTGDTRTFGGVSSPFGMSGMGGIGRMTR